MESTQKNAKEKKAKGNSTKNEPSIAPEKEKKVRIKKEHKEKKEKKQKEKKEKKIKQDKKEKKHKKAPKPSSLPSYPTGIPSEDNKDENNEELNKKILSKKPDFIGQPDLPENGDGDQGGGEKKSVSEDIDSVDGEDSTDSSESFKDKHALPFQGRERRIHRLNSLKTSPLTGRKLNQSNDKPFDQMPDRWKSDPVKSLPYRHKKQRKPIPQTFSPQYEVNLEVMESPRSTKERGSKEWVRSLLEKQATLTTQVSPVTTKTTEEESPFSEGTLERSTNAKAIFEEKYQRMNAAIASGDYNPARERRKILQEKQEKLLERQKMKEKELEVNDKDKTRKEQETKRQELELEQRRKMEEEMQRKRKLEEEKLNRYLFEEDRKRFIQEQKEKGSQLLEAEEQERLARMQKQQKQRQNFLRSPTTSLPSDASDDSSVDEVAGTLSPKESPPNSLSPSSLSPNGSTPPSLSSSPSTSPPQPIKILTQSATSTYPPSQRHSPSLANAMMKTKMEEGQDPSRSRSSSLKHGATLSTLTSEVQPARIRSGSILTATPLRDSGFLEARRATRDPLKNVQAVEQLREDRFMEANPKKAPNLSSNTRSKSFWNKKHPMAFFDLDIKLPNPRLGEKAKKFKGIGMQVLKTVKERTKRDTDKSLNIVCVEPEGIEAKEDEEDSSEELSLCDLPILQLDQEEVRKATMSFEGAPLDHTRLKKSLVELEVKFNARSSTLERLRKAYREAEEASTVSAEWLEESKVPMVKETLEQIDQWSRHLEEELINVKEKVENSLEIVGECSDRVLKLEETMQDCQRVKRSATSLFVHRMFYKIKTVIAGIFDTSTGLIRSLIYPGGKRQAMLANTANERLSQKKQVEAQNSTQNLMDLMKNKSNLNYMSQTIQALRMRDERERILRENRT